MGNPFHLTLRDPLVLSLGGRIGPTFWAYVSLPRPAGGRPTTSTAFLSYAITGIHHDRLKVSEPFPIDIDLAELTD